MLSKELVYVTDSEQSTPQERSHKTPSIQSSPPRFIPTAHRADGINSSNIGGLPPVDRPTPISLTYPAAINSSTIDDTAGRVREHSRASSARETLPERRKRVNIFRLPDMCVKRMIPPFVNILDNVLKYNSLFYQCQPRQSQKLKKTPIFSLFTVEKSVMMM